MRHAAQPCRCRLVFKNLCRELCRELCRVFEEVYESVCMAPSRMAHETLKPGLKPLAGFRLKAGLRQGVAGAPALGSKADAEVGVPASAGSERRPSGLGDGRVTVIIDLFCRRLRQTIVRHATGRAISCTACPSGFHAARSDTSRAFADASIRA
jgi:hypothetical protein